MKYLLTADLHIHPHFGNSIFIKIGINYLDYIMKYCLENNIKTIFFLGDIFHTSNKINTEIFVPVFEKIEEIRKNNIETIMIPGNHEILSEDKKTILEVFKVFSKIYNDFSYENFGGDTDFFFLPFKRRINLKKYMEEFKKINTSKQTVLLTHLDIANFKLDNNIKSKGIKDRTFFKQFGWTFSGHYHTYQQQDNIIYVGSPYQTNFGERGQKKGFIVYDDNSTWERILYNDAPEFKILTPEESLKNNINNCFVKLKINNKIDNLSKLRELLYDKGVIDVTQEFVIKEEINQLNEIKISENNTLTNMIIEFIKQDNTKLNKSKLLDIWSKLDV